MVLPKWPPVIVQLNCGDDDEGQTELLELKSCIILLPSKYKTQREGWVVGITRLTPTLGTNKVGPILRWKWKFDNLDRTSFLDDTRKSTSLSLTHNQSNVILRFISLSFSFSLEHSVEKYSEKCLIFSRIFFILKHEIVVNLD